MVVLIRQLLIQFVDVLLIETVVDFQHWFKMKRPWRPSDKSRWDMLAQQHWELLNLRRKGKKINRKSEFHIKRESVNQRKQRKNRKKADSLGLWSINIFILSNIKNNNSQFYCYCYCYWFLPWTSFRLFQSSECGNCWNCSWQAPTNSPSKTR